MTPGTLPKFYLVMMIIRTCVRSDDWLQMVYWKATDDRHAKKDHYAQAYIFQSDRWKDFSDMKDDPVNLPAHYRNGDIECIDAIRAALGDAYPDYCRGNVMKYLWRYKNKNGIEDLLKAQWYLNAMIAATRIS